MNKIKEAWRHRQNDDTGDVVQTVILIAGFVMIAIVLIVWLGTATLNRGADTAQCVESANTFRYDPYTQGLMSDQIICGNQNGFGSHKQNNSFKKDESYTNRY